MVIQQKKDCEGRIIGLHTRRTKNNSWAHELQVEGNKNTYSLFNESELFDYKLGDIVSFTFSKRNYQSGRRTPYYSIDANTISLQGCASDASVTYGFVYALTNKSMRGLVKIGYTNNTPTERAQQLSNATGVPSRFEVAYSKVIKGDASLIEKSVHAALKKQRTGTSEFFKISVNTAKSTINRIYAEIYPLQAAENDAELVRRKQEKETLRIERINKDTPNTKSEQCIPDVIPPAIKLSTPKTKYNPYTSNTLRPGIYLSEDGVEVFPITDKNEVEVPQTSHTTDKKNSAIAQAEGGSPSFLIVIIPFIVVAVIVLAINSQL